MKNEFHDRRNRWGGFKGRTLITLALVFSMIISVPLLSNAANERPAKFNPEKECSLNVTANNLTRDFEDLEQADILVVDMYLIAEAKAHNGSDGYAFDWEKSPYSSLKSIYDSLETSSEDSESPYEDLTAAALHDLAQGAARLILDEQKGTVKAGIKPAKSVIGNDTIEITGLNAGLYLLVVRGNGAASNATDKYVTITKDGDIATRAWSDTYSYVFSPQLVSLPTKNSEGGMANTADPGEWDYDLDIFMKPQRENGSLEIVKTLESYHVNGESVPVVFEVKATLGNKVVYSNVFSVIFDKAGTKRITVENMIPVGAKVTVTEVYSGATYTVGSDVEQTIDFLGNLQPAEFNFRNYYDERQRGGHGIRNRFTYEKGEEAEDGTWNWDKIEDGSQDKEE